LAGGVRPRSVGFTYGYSRLIPSGSKSPSKGFRKRILLPISGEAPEPRKPLPRVRLDSIAARFTAVINPQIHLGDSPSHTNHFLQPFERFPTAWFKTVETVRG